MHQDDVIEALLDAGADKTKLNSFGISPVDYYAHQMSKHDFQGRVSLKNGKVILSENFMTGEKIVKKLSYFNTEYPEFEDINHHIDCSILYSRKTDSNLIQKLSYPEHSNKLEQRFKKIDERIETAIRNWEEHGIGLDFVANDKIKHIHSLLTQKVNSLADENKESEADVLQYNLKESLTFLDLQAGESFEASLYDFVKNHGEEFGDVVFLRELNSHCEEKDLQKKISEEIDKIEATQQNTFSPRA